MIQLNQELVDTRSGKIATLVKVVKNKKGSLYTLRYSDDTYKRYYDYGFHRFFAELTGETYKFPKQDYSNVVFINFAEKSKFIDYESWLQWINIA